ncbi:MAG: flagellar hook-length control protein FliK, partial [Piscinibacter sp.]|nr:flagellar hook-length control protein FliK [Piscinibacter sp.]
TSTKEAGRNAGAPPAAAEDTSRAVAGATSATAAAPALRTASTESAPPALPALPATPAASPALPGPAGSTDVSLPMAPDAAGFGEAFALQVSVLARDGVQQAELHLNPAETGPVSVQIVLEGTHARVEFGADALPTRQAIEQSLPELAAALREQGLTLSGGGVSEHSRGRDAAPAEETAGSARRDAAGAPVAPVTHSVRMPRSAGGLDLYA